MTYWRLLRREVRYLRRYLAGQVRPRRPEAEAWRVDAALRELDVATGPYCPEQHEAMRRLLTRRR